MKSPLGPFGILFFASVSLTACFNFTEIKDGALSANDALLDAQSRDQPGFAEVQAAVFAPKCLACHQQYGDYTSVRLELSAILASIQSDRMPKFGGPLSSDQKSLIQRWAELGAPERTEGEASPPSPPLPPVLEPTWASISRQIVFPKCLVCHSPQGQASFLDLSTRQAFFEARDQVYGDQQKLIDFVTPERSYLISIVQDPEEPMPPTWSNLSRLSVGETSTLLEWIRRGLP